jgi:hypothetical protein
VGLDTALQVVADVFDEPPVHSTFSEMARRIRIEMDKRFSTRGWSVVVGKSYGAYITQKIKAYAYVSVFPGASGRWVELRGGGTAARQSVNSHLTSMCSLRAPPLFLRRRQCAAVEGLEAQRSPPTL